jgi:hypothetical protein
MARRMISETVGELYSKYMFMVYVLPSASQELRRGTSVCLCGLRDISMSQLPVRTRIKKKLHGLKTFSFTHYEIIQI